MRSTSAVVCSRRNEWREAVYSNRNMGCTIWVTNNQMTESHIACLLNKSSFIHNSIVIESKIKTPFKNRKQNKNTFDCENGTWLLCNYFVVVVELDL
jgi:hypothetical protein